MCYFIRTSACRPPCLPYPFHFHSLMDAASHSSLSLIHKPHPLSTLALMRRRLPLCGLRQPRPAAWLRAAELQRRSDPTALHVISGASTGRRPTQKDRVDFSSGRQSHETKQVDEESKCARTTHGETAPSDVALLLNMYFKELCLKKKKQFSFLKLFWLVQLFFLINIYKKCS